MTLKIGLVIIITGLLLMTPVFFIELKLIVRDFLDAFKLDPQATAYIIGCVLLLIGLIVSVIGIGIRKWAARQAAHDVPAVIEQTQEPDKNGLIEYALSGYISRDQLQQIYAILKRPEPGVQKPESEMMKGTQQ